MSSGKDEKEKEEEDDDLYDDVPMKLPAKKKIRPTTTTAKSNHHPKNLTELVKELEQTVERLTKENSTLKRNMGTLYRTAVAELARKDRHIERLQNLKPPPET